MDILSINTRHILEKVKNLYLFSVVILLFSCQHVFAQKRISGLVKDSENELVAGAFVLGYIGDKQIAYTYSDSLGRFSLQIKNGTADALKVTCMGYSAASITLNGKYTDIIVTLEKKAMTIKAAHVKASVIATKGDTLVYTVRPFLDGTEKVASDLLAKLPGLTITKSGGILYNGDYIGKFYVEGLDLMGNRYSVITNNMSASEIDRVEVYKNHQPIKVLQNQQHSDKAAVNIILKESSRNIWLFSGDASIGSAPFPQFEARALLSRFSKSVQNLFLLKGNNTGIDLSKEIQQQAYYGKTGVYLLSNDSFDADFATILVPPRKKLPIPEEFWLDNLSLLCTANQLKKTGETSQLRLSMQIAGEKVSSERAKEESIFLMDDSILKIANDECLSDKSLYGNITASYEDNRKDRYVYDEFSVAGELRKQTSDLFTDLPISQTYKLPSLKVSNSFKATKAVSNKSSITVSLDSKYINNSHSATYIFPENISKQEYSAEKYSTDLGFSMRTIWKAHQLSIESGVHVDGFRLSSQLDTQRFEDLKNNRNKNNLFKVSPFIQLSDFFYAGPIRFMISLPLTWNYISGHSVISSYSSFTPRLQLYVNPTTDLDVTFTSSFGSRRSSPESLLGSVVMTDYRTLSAPDSLMHERTFRSSLSVNYSCHPALLYFSLSGMVYWGRHNRTSSGYYNATSTVTEYINHSATNNFWSVSGSAKKYFGIRTMQIDLHGSYSRSEQNEMLQYVPIKLQSDNINFSASINYNPISWLNLHSVLNYSLSSFRGYYSMSSNALHFENKLTINPIKKLSVLFSAIHWKEWIKSASSSSIPLLKSSITLSFRKADFYIECRNILNKTIFERKYFSSYSSVVSQTVIPKRRFIIGIRMLF